MDETYEYPAELAISVAHLRGNPHFDNFLASIAQIRDAALWDLESYNNIGSHAVLARAGGVISVTREILRNAEVDES